MIGTNTMQTLRGMITVHKKNKITTILAAIVLLSTITAGYVFEISTQNMQSRLKLPWYDVADWEVDACAKWGGRTESQQITTQQPAQSYGDMTLTIQAKKIKSKNETLYEVTYFIQSYSATTDYTIKLENKKTGSTKEITRGTLGPENGATNYWAQTLQQDYDTAIIEYYKGRITAPIIEVR